MFEEIADIASFIVQHPTKDTRDAILNLSQLLGKEYDEKANEMLSDEKKILNIILEWEKKRDQKEPARIEMGRTLVKMGMPELAARLNLYSFEDAQ